MPRQGSHERAAARCSSTSRERCSATAALRDVHLAQLRSVGETIGVTASDAELRAELPRGHGRRLPVDRDPSVLPPPRAVRRRVRRHGELARWSPRRRTGDAGGRPPVRGDDRRRRAAHRLPRHVGGAPPARAPRADRVQHRRRAARRARRPSRSGGRDRRVDELGVGAARASPTPASTGARWRRPGARPRTCCSWATARCTTSTVPPRWGCRPRCSSPTPVPSGAAPPPRPTSSIEALAQVVEIVEPELVR